MKTKILLLALFCSLQITFLSAQTNPVIKYFPENISLVARISPAHMHGKITREEFRSSIVYKMLTKDSSKLDSLSLFGSPSHTGINFANDLFVLKGSEPSEEGKEKTTVTIYGSLQDGAAFGAILKKFLPKDSIYVYGSNRVVIKSPLLVAWNEEVFVLEVNKGGSSGGMDTLQGKQLQAAKSAARKKERERCFALLTPHANSFWTGDPRFLALINTAADISIWQGGQKSTGLPENNPFSKYFNIGVFQPSVKSNTINFEDGAIRMRGNSYPSDSIKAIYEKFPPPPQNTELVRHLPGNPLLFMNFSYNPDASKEMSKMVNLQPIKDSIKKYIPFDLSQFNSTFNGQMIFALLPPDQVKPASLDEKAVFNITLLLAAPISDKAKFDELKTKTIPAWDSLMMKPGFADKLKDIKPYVKYNDKYCVLSNSPDAAAKFLEEPTGSLDPEWVVKYSQYPYFMNLHFKDLMMTIAALAPKKEGKKKGLEQAMPFLSLFDQFNISGGRYENHSLNSLAEIKMPDSSQNSLRQLFLAINKMISGGLE